MSLILTAAEEAQIWRQRNSKAEKKKKALLTHKYLTTAAKFKQWLEDNDRGASYSAFADEFGFDGENSDDVYRAVQSILNFCSQL